MLSCERGSFNKPTGRLPHQDISDLAVPPPLDARVDKDEHDEDQVIHGHDPQVHGVGQLPVRPD